MRQSSRSLQPASPGLPWDPGEQTLINLLIIKCLRASYHPGAQGSMLQGSSSLHSLFTALFWVLTPKDTRIWWVFIPKEMASKGQGCSMQPEARCVPACGRFVQKEQEPLALTHIWCQCGLHQHHLNSLFNPMSLPLAACRHRKT